LRAMWKGSLSFGLVNIPVKLFAATEERGIKFRYLHTKCHAPLEYQKVCPNCKEQVAWESIARGYEYETGHFVVLTDEEIQAAAGPKDRLIEIEDFVDLKEVDPIYFQKGYYLAPDGPGKKPYVLLREVMLHSGRVAVATVTLRARQTPAVVRVFGKTLALSTMHYADEIRAAGSVPDLPGEMEIKQREFDMALELVESLNANFEPDKYRDFYRERLQELIQAKLEGKEISVAPVPDQEKVVDLLEALQASVEKSQEQKKIQGKGRGSKKKGSASKAGAR